MNVVRNIKSRRILVCSPLIAIGLLLAPMAALTSFAHQGGCRSDPIVFLSNGNKVQLSATIGDDLSNIQQITFTIHMAKGVTVTGVQYTQGFQSLEQLVVDTNDPAGTYDTYTYVETKDSGVAVTTTGVVVYKSGTQSQMASTSGWANQKLHLQFSG